MTTLVTGAAGFVGLNLLDHLLAAGRSVVALDQSPLPAVAETHLSRLPGHLHFVLGRVDSSAELGAAFAAAPIEAVIHCAVITAGSERETREPETIVATNVQAAAALLVTAAHQGVRRFVYPSSGAVYGHAARAASVLHEDELVPAPANLYAATKLAAETILGRIAETQGVSFVAARLATVFGPWEYATGVRDTLSPMLQAMELAQRHQEAVLSTPFAGDYIYVRDVAAGLVHLADAPLLPRNLYNLGSGRLASARSWCELLAVERPAFRWRLAAPEEPANVITHAKFDRAPMNTALLATDLGFSARHGLAEALRDYLWRSA